MNSSINYLHLCLLLVTVGTSVTQGISFDNDYPQNVTAAEGKTARFTCVLLKDHEPTDHVSWVKHHENLDGDKENPRYSFTRERISSVIYEFILKIDPVERSDATDYRCVFSSSTHTISSKKAFLNVLQVPSKIYPICNQNQPNYFINDDVQITCVSERTSPAPYLEFFPMTDLALSHQNATHIWMSIDLNPITMSHVNGTVFGCVMYIDVISDRQYCYTDALYILDKLRVTIYGNTYYALNQEAVFICSGNVTDNGNYTWSYTNQIFTNLENQLNITVSPKMNGMMITCTIDDAGYIGSDTIILSVEDVPMTTAETLKTTSVPPKITKINPTLTSDDL